MSAKPTSPTRTPEQSPSRRPMGITQAQKQALIDNLQLEVTERARKLRAQYALQAQGLRARLEMRVNRIPQALRKTKIQELFVRYAEPHVKPPPPALAISASPKVQAAKAVHMSKPAIEIVSSPARTKGVKRS
ncbi:hypothetical protein LTR28_012852, partial [Elasticomyces elasticus]